MPDTDPPIPLLCRPFMSAGGRRRLDPATKLQCIVICFHGLYRCFHVLFDILCGLRALLQGFFVRFGLPGLQCFYGQTSDSDIVFFF